MAEACASRDPLTNGGEFGEYAHMRRTTFTLPDDLAAEVARDARRRRTSVSEVLRDSLAKQLGCEPGKQGWRALVGSASRAGAKGQPGEYDFDAELEKTWSADIVRHQDP